MAWDNEDFVEALRLAAKAAGFEPGGECRSTSTENRQRTIRITREEREMIGDYRTWARKAFPEDRFNRHNQATTAALVGLVESKGVSAVGDLLKYEDPETGDWIITGTPIEDVWHLDAKNPYLRELAKDQRRQKRLLRRDQLRRRRVRRWIAWKVAGPLFLIVLGAILWWKG